MTIEPIRRALPLLGDLACGVAIRSGADCSLQPELVAERRITHEVEQKGERRAGVAEMGWLACHDVAYGFNAAQRMTPTLL
jgi:hypothetical protein